MRRSLARYRRRSVRWKKSSISSNDRTLRDGCSAVSQVQSPPRMVSHAPTIPRPPSQTGSSLLSDEILLDRFQERAFRYFTDGVNRANGLVPDTTRPQYPSSIALVGFALTSYIVGVERGWIRREEAALLTLAALRFFHGSEQSEAREATGHRGF